MTNTQLSLEGSKSWTSKTFYDKSKVYNGGTQERTYKTRSQFRHDKTYPNVKV